jgi:hypothetical protein
MANDECMICNQPGAKVTAGSRGGRITETADCPRCGKWWLFVDTVGDIDMASRPLKAALAAHIRQANATNPKPVELTANWRDYAEAHRNTPIPQKLDLLLRQYEKLSEYAGDWVRLSDDTYPLIDAQNPKEVFFLKDTLVARGVLEQSQNRGQDEYRLTATGWTQLHPQGGVTGTCFVAMSFDAALTDDYEHGIRAALEVDCGYRALRLDRAPANGDITNRMIADIRSCQFMVADFTGHRPGVYYEAGFAEGLRRPVVRTCRADHFDRLHFDTRQFHHLKWTTFADLREQLSDHVKATIDGTMERLSARRLKTS